MQYLQNCRALARAHLGPRGLKVLSAQGYTQFEKCHSGFVYVVRSLVTLRLLGKHMQHQEEGSKYLSLSLSVYIYIYIYTCNIYI